MKKKIIYVLSALAVLVFAFVIYYFNIEQRKDNGTKTINISIVVEQNAIFSDSFKTNSSTLEELLVELNEEGKIFLDYENSEYGMYIKGMGKEELISEDPSSSKYWTYSSDNNDDCLKNAFCPAASSLIINDGDTFVFELIKYE